MQKREAEQTMRLSWDVPYRKISVGKAGNQGSRTPELRVARRPLAFKKTFTSVTGILFSVISIVMDRRCWILDLGKCLVLART